MAEPTGNKWGGNQNGINFDDTAEIPLSKAASLLMPQTKNGSVLEPHLSDNRMMAPIRSQKQKNMKNIHKNRVFVLYPLREKKEILSKWFSFGTSRCLPDGREIFKIIHKNRVFMLYPLGGKNYFRKNLIFFAFPCSTPWGDLSEISEAIHKIRVFVLYHLREKNIYGKGAVFDHPRCLPIEGRKIYFFKRLNF